MPTLKERLFAKWVVCKAISDKKSIQYGLRFSYPTYMLIVFAGVLLQNFILLLTAILLAFLAIKLPLHPLDYLFNYVASKIESISTIPGRGSELQVTSVIAILFNLAVVALILLNATVNYAILATLYIVFSSLFITILLTKD